MCHSEVLDHSSSCSADVAHILAIIGNARGAPPDRFRILLLCRNPQQPTYISEELKLTKSWAVKHLKQMLKHNLVSVRAEGSRRFYQTRPEVLHILAYALDAYAN